MMRAGNNLLDLNLEGSEITGGDMIYWIKGVEYKHSPLSLTWLKGEIYDVTMHPSDELGKLRPLTSLSGANELIK